METKDEINLLEKHKDLVKIICRKYFAGCGVPEQDLFQEGMIALFKAIQTFDQTKANKFETYASKVIRNRLIDIIRKENGGISAAILTDNIEEVYTTQLTTEDTFNTIEKSDTIKKILEQECTETERAIFKSHLRGHSYDEIAAIFDVTKKKIDNTIQKIKNKIRSKL